MAERCELCGARWEVGAGTCRDCGSRRRITVQPGESSASMPGLEFVREALAKGAVPVASDSLSDVVMVRVDASSAPVPAADASASGVPLARDPAASAPVSAAVPVAREALVSASTSAALPAGALPSSMSTLPPGAAAPPSSSMLPSSVSTLPPTRLAAAAAPATTPSPGSSLTSGAVQTVLPPGFSQPLGRPAGGRALLGLGVVAIVAGAGIGVALWLGRTPAEPEAKQAPVEVSVNAEAPAASCEQLTALAGAWVFTTATTGARRKERLGVRGFYQLQITVDGCSARASLAKTGRTDRTLFDDDKIPRAEAPLARGEGLEAYGWSGSFVLRNEDGQGIDTRFVFALDGERLVGSWRQLGERWATSGLYGVLEGRRSGDPVALLPERGTQPCMVRCATPDDITSLDAPDEGALAACLASCSE